MAALAQIAYFQNRRDEVPNQQLARILHSTKDRKGIQDIARHLWDDNPQIQSDCLKVLYEIGFLDPSLISDWISDFVKLLNHNNNRLVWGSMIAISTLAQANAAALFKRRMVIQQTIKSGSVITVDNGIKTLAAIAASSPARNQVLFPFLLKHLESCRPKEIPQHAEKTLVAVRPNNGPRFIRILENRLPEMTAAQSKRTRRIIQEAHERCRDRIPK